MDSSLKIKDIFNAISGSLYDTFMSHNGNIGFAIPIYQRKYDWEAEHIERLFEDVVNGLSNPEKDALTFLGAIILVDEGRHKESTFDGESYSIVDGQQRLTTICLIFSILIEMINILLSKANITDKEVREWANKEAEILTNDLFGCLLGNSVKTRRARESKYNYFPRLIRKGKQLDNRASSGHDADYNSHVGFYIHEFGEFVNSNPIDREFIFNPKKKDDDYQSFDRNLKVIKKCIYKLSKAEEPWGDYLPSINQLLSKNYMSLFSEVSKKENPHKFLESIHKVLSDSFEPFIRLIAVGNYLLHKVALTRVEVVDEKYAFDIFEALNTTGEPLTAIETFRPRVIDFENSTEEQYENSQSAIIFSGIDEILNKHRKGRQRQSETRDTVISFALYLTGEKIAATPAVQRKYLRSGYEMVAAHSNEKELRRRFVKHLWEILDYRDRFWDSDKLRSQLMGEFDREEILFYLQFAKDLNSSLMIPILCRYFFESKDKDDWATFKEATRALGSFVLLRRMATGGTKGIDSDFRAIMEHGGRSDKDPQKPLRRWLISKQGFKEENYGVPSIEELKKILRSYLSGKLVEIKNEDGLIEKNLWKSRFINLPMYEYKELCKAILLVAFHGSVPDAGFKKEGLLIKARKNPQETNFISLASLQSDMYSTIEHVAPQSLAKGSDWDKAIYKGDDLYLKDSIGNLTLLPFAENNEASNTGWKIKRHLYKAFSAQTKGELESIFERAKKAGFDFKKKTKELLIERNHCLPVVGCISTVDSWNAEFIKKRSENIADLVWRRLFKILCQVKFKFPNASLTGLQNGSPVATA